MSKPCLVYPSTKGKGKTRLEERKEPIVAGPKKEEECLNVEMEEESSSKARRLNGQFDWVSEDIEDDTHEMMYVWPILIVYKEGEMRKSG